MIIMAMGGVAMMALMAFLMGPEGRAFLKAKIKRKPLATIHRNDRRREYKVVNTATPELWDIPGYGGYNVDPNAIEITPSNIRVADVPAEVGATFPTEMVIKTNDLKDKGIDNFAEAETTDDPNKLETKNIFGSKKMFSWQDFKNYLPNLQSPIHIRGAVERGVRAQTPSVTKEPWSKEKFIGVGIMVFIIFIAVFILFESGMLQDLFGGLGGGEPTPAPPINV